MVKLDAALKQALERLCVEEKACVGDMSEASSGGPARDAKLTAMFCKSLLLDSDCDTDLMPRTLCKKSQESDGESAASVLLMSEASASDLQQLTSTEGACSSNWSTIDDAHRYPSYPLAGQLASCLSQWMEFGVCPVGNSPQLHLLEETKPLLHQEEVVRSVELCIANVRSSWDSLSFDAQVCHLQRMVTVLGVWGILQLLGLRRTAGSVPLLPPPRSRLLASFNTVHKPPNKLSVGARALAKHCHRDGNTWWGVCTGKELEKNQQAEAVVCRILDDVCWMNVHLLPHDISVLEVRQRDGYGARWLSSGSEFRGFLEPQMEDGHSVNWRHAPESS